MLGFNRVYLVGIIFRFSAGSNAAYMPGLNQASIIWRYITPAFFELFETVAKGAEILPLFLKSLPGCFWHRLFKLTGNCRSVYNCIVI
jgi:hypothetical protein